MREQTAPPSSSFAGKARWGYAPQESGSVTIMCRAATKPSLSEELEVSGASRVQQLKKFGVVASRSGELRFEAHLDAVAVACRVQPLVVGIGDFDRVTWTEAVFVPHFVGGKCAHIPHSGGFGSSKIDELDPFLVAGIDSGVYMEMVLRHLAVLATRRAQVSLSIRGCKRLALTQA